ARGRGHGAGPRGARTRTLRGPADCVGLRGLRRPRAAEAAETVARGGKAEAAGTEARRPGAARGRGASAQCEAETAGRTGGGRSCGAAREETALVVACPDTRIRDSACGVVSGMKMAAGFIAVAVASATAMYFGVSTFTSAGQ